MATDLTLAAMGGAMALNGDPDRRPLRVTVPQTWHHAAAESAVGALVAHQCRQLTGEAQFVDVSVQAAVFWTGLQAMIAHAIDGKDMERNGTVLQLSTLVTPLVYPCADGEVCLVATGETVRGLLPWMVASGAVTADWVEGEDWDTYDVRMLTGQPLVHSLDDMRAGIVAFTKLHTKAELFAGGIARGVTVAPVSTVADVLSLEQLAVRDYWDEVELPSGRSLRAAGPFVKASATPVAWTRPAPAIGEHTAEVLAELDATPLPRVEVKSGRASGRLPLEGVKVADFSWIGVGPITAKALGDHGATVVHVESDSPADRLRLVGPFKDGIPGINRCQFFNGFNTSKLSLQLNLKHPTGVDIAQPAAGVVRHRPRLVHRGHDGRPRPRLRRRPRAQPRHRHGDDLPARPVPGRPPSSPATATTPPRSAASTRSPAGPTGRRPARSTPTPTPSRRAS